jgi:hypothetical protein
MTDTEIIKALECCRTNIVADCKRCNLRLEDGTTRPYCTTILIGNALDLINRQKAEIERLKIEKDNLIRTYAECQAEAVKEFAERLKDVVGWIEITVDDIDNLLKETVGDADG